MYIETLFAQRNIHVNIVEKRNTFVTMWPLNNRLMPYADELIIGIGIITVALY